MKCPACQTESGPGATECASCRASLPPNCAGCGAPVEPGVELCAACRTAPTRLADPAAADGADDDGAAADGADDDEDVEALPDDALIEEDDDGEDEEPTASRRSPALAVANLEGAAVSALAAGAAAPTSDGAAAPTHPAPPTPPIAAGPTPPDVASPAADATATLLDAATPVHLAAQPSEAWMTRPRLVGRDSTLARLVGLVTRAVADRRVAFAALIGPAGSGKTRLLDEIAPAVRAAHPSARVLLGACGGPGAPPFAVFSRLLGDRLGLLDHDPPEVARDKISRGVAELVPAPRALEVTHLLARLLGVGFAASPVVEPLADKAAQLESRTFIAVRRFLAADAASAPLVLIFDEVQRGREDTVRLIHYLAAGLGEQPVVLLVAGRPDLFTLHPNFGQGETALERIDLAPLGADESGELFVELVRQAGEPPMALLRHARERLGGSPRAVVELVRYLVETGGIKRIGSRWTFDRVRFARGAVGPGGAPVPAAIEELLAARLAALDPARRDLLEKAAACGPTFWLDALVALLRSTATADPDGPPLEEISAAGDRARAEASALLAALVEQGLVTRSQHSRIPGEQEFQFAYPPWWEVIDATLTAQARRRYHKLIAQWLELRPAGRGEVEQAEVASHLELAGDGDGAALRYRRAADAARARYYNDEAIRLFGRALACVSESDVATRIHLWHDLGSVFQLKGEHVEARRAFERMLRLAWMVASRPKAAVAYNKIGRIDRQRGELSRALEHFKLGLEMFESAGDERGVAGTLDDTAQVLWLLGRYDEARARADSALELRRALGDRQSIALSLLTIGHIERHRGLFAAADASYHEALAIRRDLDDKAGIAAVLNGLGALAFQRGDYDGARGGWEEAVSLAEAAGALPMVAVVESHLGEVARALGNVAEARTWFERSEAAARALGDKRLLSEALRNLALIELADAELVKSRDLAQRAFDLADGAGIRVDAGRALVTLGEIHAQTLFGDIGEGGGGDEYFRRAVELFREIGNQAELGVALERSGAFSVERGKVEEGKAMLAEAQAIFSRLGMKAFDASATRVIMELD